MPTYNFYLLGLTNIRIPSGKELVVLSMIYKNSNARVNVYHCFTGL